MNTGTFVEACRELIAGELQQETQGTHVLRRGMPGLSADAGDRADGTSASVDKGRRAGVELPSADSTETRVGILLEVMTGLSGPFGERVKILGYFHRGSSTSWEGACRGFATDGACQGRRWQPWALNLGWDRVPAQGKTPFQDPRKWACSRRTTQVLQRPAGPNTHYSAVGNPMNRFHYAAHVATLGWLHETAPPSYSDHPLRGQHTIALAKVCHTTSSSAGAAACDRSWPTYAP